MERLLIEPKINASRFRFKGMDCFIRKMESVDRLIVHGTDDSGFERDFEMNSRSFPVGYVPIRFVIANALSFTPGRALFCYRKGEDYINMINALVIQCSDEMLSFIFRDTGGEFREQGLTANQIYAKDIEIFLYDKPKIW